jgi:hypothetical protein
VKPERRTVLVAVLEYGELPELLRTANAIRDGIGGEVVFFFIKPSYRRLIEDTRAVLAHGHRWMDAMGVVRDQSACAARSGVKAAPLSESVQDRSSAPPSGPKALAVDLINLAADFRRFRARGSAIDGILSQSNPALIVVGQDAVGSELSFLIGAAKRQDIAVLLVPFAMFNLSELAEYALARPAHSADAGLLNRLVARLFPRWVMTFRGRRILRLPGSRALALELSGLAPSRPWTPCASALSSIACDSELTRRSMVQMGVDDQKISVVGAPVHDRLAGFKSQSKVLLAERFNFNQVQPLIVCGWPANIFPWLGTRRINYPDYPSIARVWAKALAEARDKFQCEVLISVHPKTLDVELVEPHARGLRTVRGDSDELIAHCDLFTTLNGSSVTAWAIACGKPVLLFDCFETGYPEFEAAPGCLMVQTETWFLDKLMELAGDAGMRRRLAEKQASVAADWGVLDGRAQWRLEQLARRLVTREAEPLSDPENPARLMEATG